MSKQCLDIEQMKHLKDLGVDISKASAVVYKVSETETYCGYARDIAVIDGYIEKYIDKYPIFTLQDILDLLPEKIDDCCALDMWKRSGRWTIAYVDVDSSEIYEDFRCNNLIECAYKMLCWCIENGYVKTNKED